MFIEVAHKRAIYALIKNSAFVNFTLFIKRYPSQLIEKVRVFCQKRRKKMAVLDHETPVKYSKLIVVTILSINITKRLLHAWTRLTKLRPLRHA